VYEGSGSTESPYLIRTSDSRIVQVSRLLYLVAGAMDGRQDHRQIAATVSSSYGRAVTAANVDLLVERKLRPLGLVAGDTARRPRAPGALELHARFGVLSPRAVQAATVALLPLFNRVVVAAVLAALVAVETWLWRGQSLTDAIARLLAEPALILPVVALVVACAAFHELGHATACRYGGARPGRVGAGLYLFWPVFFTDVTASYRLDRAGRLRTDLGGVYFNGLAVLVLAACYGATGFAPLLVVIAVQHLLVLQQFVPFVRLDGYYVVCDLAGVPDLFDRVGPAMHGVLRGRSPAAALADLDRRARRIVLAWMVVTVPVLAAVAGAFAVRLPGLTATGRQSLSTHARSFGAAVDTGNGVAAALALVQMAALVVPLAGVSLLVARIALTFRHRRNQLRKERTTPPMASLRPEDLESKRFPVVRRGYAPEEVHTFLQDAARTWRAQEAAAPPPAPAPEEGLAEAVTTIVRQAAIGAAEILAVAQREADAIRARARAHLAASQQEAEAVQHAAEAAVTRTIQAVGARLSANGHRPGGRA
jgi:putative peptide zinc metalloprotease protein